ncbi:peptidoglycan-binding protein LysM [Noviherbaspirillum cavernae]|uniref:peptidoglycan-binding protein LysM n=1 Tax=Noviherbaspirillum cavernae TaxID=2320862 RepID=UPI001F5BF0F5|nr:peptidoglycan-binding protein LysM [Noviherbaspirillum cavernae]
MGLISFLKEAGEKFLKTGSSNQDSTIPATQTTQVNIREKEQALERAILDYMAVQNLPIENLTVLYDSSAATVTVSGSAPDQQTREKIILCCGNVQGVAHVNDQINVEQVAEESQWYTVKAGDTLSKISKEYYGNANQYGVIFDANKPMLKDPDKIYPGQLLRIPAKP